MNNKKLLKKISNEVHKPVKKKFPRRKVIVDGIDDVWSCDLVDMQQFVNDNGKYKYILNVIDVFSKYAWSIPLQDKTAKTVVNAFNTIIKDSGRKPHRIWVDKGTEFYNKSMDKWLKDYAIIRYSTYGEHKSSVVERFNRTMKTNMWKYFTQNQTNKWIDILPKLVDNYLNRKHSSIGMTPIDASNKKNEKKVFQKLYGDIDLISKKTSKFKLGDMVRISNTKGKFEKGYLPGWSFEIFKIIGISYTNPIVYDIADYNGDKVEGTFYEQELQLTKQTDKFIVDEILQRKTVKGKKMVLVKWYGYPDKFNEWLPAENVENINKSKKK